MDIFDKIGQKASEAYKITADKTGKIAKETKLKLRMGEIKAKTSEIYEEIGKKIYEKHIRKENISIKKDLEEEITKLDVLSDEMDDLLKQCLELRNKKQCPSCYTEIEKDMNYCPNCGIKQEKEEVKEVEVIEKQTDDENKEENKLDD